MSDAPASNCHWYFTNINTIDYDPLDHQLDPTPDNYEDYKIYYAIDNVGDGLTNEVKCLSRYEMDFYDYHMTDLAIIEEISTGKKFNYCEVIHRDDYLDYPPYPMYIQHDYTLYIGYRFLECSFEIEDILNQ